MVESPAMDKHVFCRVLEDCGHVELDDEGCALHCMSRYPSPPSAACTWHPEGSAVLRDGTH